MHFCILALLELNVVLMLSIYKINGDGYLYCLWIQFNVCIAMFWFSLSPFLYSSS